MLYFTRLYVVTPAVHMVQELYAEYHAEVFDPDTGLFDEDMWEEAVRQRNLLKQAGNGIACALRVLFRLYTSDRDGADAGAGGEARAGARVYSD